MTPIYCAVLELTDIQSQVLGEHLSSVRAVPSRDFGRFREQVAEVMSLAAPAALNQVLSRMKSRDARAPVTLLKNAPLPRMLPPTPNAEVSAIPENLISTAFLVGCGLTLGCIYAFGAERGGALIHDIVPVPDKANSLSSSGSRFILDLHSEVAFHVHQPDFVLLSCLRNPPTAAATLVADVSSCVAE